MNSFYNQKLNVVIYARVSTDNSSQETSIKNQLSYFISFIQNNKNLNLVGKYIDIGISGKNVKKRENFLKMISDAKAKKFDYILTKSVSRFARNTLDSIYYTNILKENNVGVYFVNDNINTLDSDSEFRLTLMSSLAQDELRKLSDNIKFGLNTSINRGLVLGNSNIIGYNKKNGILTINEYEKNIIIDTYNYFLKTKSYTETSKYINHKYQKNYYPTTIKRILINYKYKGYYCGRKTTVIDYKKGLRKDNNKKDWVLYKSESIPIIIDEYTWNKVNSIINQNKKTNYRIECRKHGRVYVKIRKYKNKQYKYIVCQNCFRLNLSIISKIIHNKKCYITKRENDYKIDIVI